MSELTFNIADYRPLSVVRTRRVQTGIPMAKKSRNFVVLSSNARIYEQEDRWMKSRPGVVDIASIRETPHGVRLSCHPGSYPRRGKILHFNGDEPERVITMPPQNNRVTSEDDPDPGNFPSAA